MNTTIDILYLRRPKLVYVSPPICDFIPFSGSGSGFPTIVPEPVAVNPPPADVRIVFPTNDAGFKLCWEAYMSTFPTIPAFGYTVYRSNPDDPFGAYTIIANGITVTCLPIDQNGCYRVSAITLEGETELSAPACVTTICTAPTATTEPADGITGESAALHGTANPNGSVTSVFFEWGIDGELSNTTPIQNIGNGTDPVSASAVISGLEPGQTYSFRLIATGCGTINGETFTFDTPAVPICDDSEVNDWVSRVAANGGSVSESTHAAACTFMTAIKAAGLREKILRLNLYAGDQLAACMVPLIIDGGFAVENEIFEGSPFAESDYSESTGLTGTGNTTGPVPWPPQKYINTGFFPIDEYDDVNSMHCAIYARTNEEESAAAMLASHSGVGSSSFGIIIKYQSAGDLSMGFLSESTGASLPADPDGLGFYQANRVSDVTSAFYKNGVQVGTNVTSGGILADVCVFVHAQDDSLFHDEGASKRTYAGYSLGLGMDETESAAFYAAWQAFQTALGRAV